MSARFDIFVAGFESESVADSERNVSRVFGMEPGWAARFVASLPRVVKREVAEADAHGLRAALRQIGAHVELRPSPIRPSGVVVVGSTPSRGSATVSRASLPTPSGGETMAAFGAPPSVVEPEGSGTPQTAQTVRLSALQPAGGRASGFASGVERSHETVRLIVADPWSTPRPAPAVAPPSPATPVDPWSMPQQAPAARASPPATQVEARPVPRETTMMATEVSADPQPSQCVDPPIAGLASRGPSRPGQQALSVAPPGNPVQQQVLVAEGCGLDLGLPPAQQGEDNAIVQNVSEWAQSMPAEGLAQHAHQPVSLAVATPCQPAHQASHDILALPFEAPQQSVEVRSASARTPDPTVPRAGRRPQPRRPRLRQHRSFDMGSPATAFSSTEWLRHPQVAFLGVLAATTVVALILYAAT